MPESRRPLCPGSGRRVESTRVRAYQARCPECGLRMRVDYSGFQKAHIGDHMPVDNAAGRLDAWRAAAEAWQEGIRAS